MIGVTAFGELDRFDADEPVTDAEVVARVHRGDPWVFEILVRRHARSLYRTLRMSIRDDDRIERAMIDGFVGAYRTLAADEGERGFCTDLLRGAVQHVHEAARMRSATPSSDLRGALAISDDRAPVPLAELRVVEQSIDALPTGARLAFVLRDVEGFGTAAIAQMLGLTPDTVRTRLDRARRKIRRLLAPELTVLLPAAFPLVPDRADRVAAAVMQTLARG